MGYDPFLPGPFEVTETATEAHDRSRDRRFPCALWRPEVPGRRPTIVYSHHSGGNRRSAAFLCSHLASHGYLVAALDHSERVAPELAPAEGETEARRDERRAGIVGSRVPDLRFLLDVTLSGDRADPDRVGVVGHSFGGWTALSLPDVDERVGSIVALAPGGSSNPRPGVLRAPLKFAWSRPVPVLYLVAEGDVALPLDGMVELFEHTPGTPLMAILRRADHLHFVDDIEAEQEAYRSASVPEELSYLAREMLPFGELCPPEEAHAFNRGLTLAHLDATLRDDEEARRFLAGDVVSALAERGVTAIIRR